MIHQHLKTIIRGFETVTALVSQNARYADVSDRLAIRPGTMDEDDVYPAVVIAVPHMDVDADLSYRGGFAKATVSVRALGFSLSVVWELMRCIAWNGGDPDDTSRLASGLDGYQDLANGIQTCKLLSTDEASINPDDKSDRTLWVIESTYEVQFDLGTLIRLENA